MNPEKLAALIMLVSLMLNAGLQVNFEHLRDVIGRPSLLLRALLANFIIVPVFGVVITRLFNLPPEISIGFLLMAVAPGVPFVTQAGGRKKGGSLGFAVELAALMQALSIVLVPLWLAYIMPDERADVPYLRVATTLFLFQLLPLFVGMLIVSRSPALAERLTRPTLYIFLIALLAVLALASPMIGKAIAAVYGSLEMIAAVVLTVLAIAVGWLLGGPEGKYRRTLGIATGLRNVGLALTIATTNFAGTLVPAAVICYLLAQVIVSLIIGIYFMRKAKAETAASA